MVKLRTYFKIKEKYVPLKNDKHGTSKPPPPTKKKSAVHSGRV